MNERIQELIGQCIDQRWTVTGPMFDREKFAELIVKECIEIVEKNESEIHYDNGMYPVYPTVCEIKAHFGVEE